MPPASRHARVGAGTRFAARLQPPALDPASIASALAAPERGPRIVFLSGGTALRGLSRALTRYSHNCAHLITPFDSGGSSASLRDAFAMPAVGDLRNRLLAISSGGPASLRRGLQSRLPQTASPDELARHLEGLASGEDPLFSDVPAPDAKRLRGALARLRDALPEDFDLRGASVGNLALTGSYLVHDDLEAAVDELGAMLRTRGIVLPSSTAHLHLAARLEDGELVVGQHRLTAKQHPPLRSPIAELFLVTPGDARARPVRPPASPRAVEQIERADLICYPMGSFYSSVLCNTLPEGIGRAIARARCPKLYVPSTGRDPELIDTPLSGAARTLRESLMRDLGDPGPEAPELLDGILIDTTPDIYPTAPDLEAIRALGIRPLPADLVSPGSLPDIDSDRLARMLVSLATRERGQHTGAHMSAHEHDEDKPELKLHWDTTKVTNPEMWDQKRRLADAMRLVIERLVPSNAPVEELRAAADGLERYAEALKAHPRLLGTHGHAESANAGDVGAFFDQSPLIGLANPLAPPITVGRTGEHSAAATVTFGSAYEGPPGCVHGGFIAAAFDEVLGYAQSLSGAPGMTGTLTVRYRKPTPLHEELRFEAEFVRMERRKIFCEGTVTAGGVTTAEAEGIFISALPGSMEGLLRKREAWENEHAG